MSASLENIFHGGTQKTMALRVAHAVLFELGLLIVLMPFIAWYMGVSLMQALVMDIAFALFYLVYAFFFNLAYDRIFPLPEWQTEAKTQYGTSHPPLRALRIMTSVAPSSA